MTLGPKDRVSREFEAPLKGRRTLLVGVAGLDLQWLSADLSGPAAGIREPGEGGRRGGCIREEFLVEVFRRVPRRVGREGPTARSR